MCQVQAKQQAASQQIYKQMCLDLVVSALCEDTEGVCCLACCIQPVLPHLNTWPQSLTI